MQGLEEPATLSSGKSVSLPLGNGDPRHWPKESRLEYTPVSQNCHPQTHQSSLLLMVGVVSTVRQLKGRCDDAKTWSHHESVLTYGLFLGFGLISNLNGLAVPRSQESQETKNKIKKNLVKTPPGWMHGPINQVKLPSQSGPRPLSKLISLAGNRTAPKIPSFRTKHSSPQGGSMNEKAGIWQMNGRHIEIQGIWLITLKSEIIFIQ